MTVTPEAQPEPGAEWETLIDMDGPAGPDGPICRSIAEVFRHRASVLSVAEEFHKPLDEVACLYREELVRLGAHAHVTDFLPILVSKKIRERYKYAPAGQSGQH